jgi:hypothetical protein
VAKALLETRVLETSGFDVFEFRTVEVKLAIKSIVKLEYKPVTVTVDKRGKQKYKLEVFDLFKGLINIGELWSLAQISGYRDRYQAIFVFRYLQEKLGMTIEQIAKITGYSTTTVAQYLKEIIPIKDVTLPRSKNVQVFFRSHRFVRFQKPSFRNVQVPHQELITRKLKPPVLLDVRVSTVPIQPNAVKFRSVPAHQAKVNEAKTGPKTFAYIPLRFFSPVLVKTGLTVEEQYLERVANASQLTMILLKKDLGELGIVNHIGEPIIIITRRKKEGFSYYYVMLEICKELYREIKGDLPTPYILVKLEQLGNFLSIGEKFSNKIILFDFQDFQKEELEEELKKYGYAFKELFSQGLCFLLFLSETTDLADLLSKQLAYPYKPKIVDFSEHTVDKVSARLFGQIVEILWGKNFEQQLAVFHPDLAISEVQRMYKDTLTELLRLSKYIYPVRRGQNESDEHLALKILAFKHLVEEEGVKPEEIETEAEIENNAIADIYISKNKMVIEVETLYKAGPAPLLNIRDSVLKYENSNKVSEIRVVLRNFPTALHLKELWKLRKFLNEKMKQKVEFYVPSLSTLKLVSLKDVLHKLKTVMGLTKQSNIDNRPSSCG